VLYANILLIILKDLDGDVCVLIPQQKVNMTVKELIEELKRYPEDIRVARLNVSEDGEELDYVILIEYIEKSKKKEGYLVIS
jgi:hypothetical protein